MDNLNLNELTKKNQEFIHIATHQLIQDGKSDEEVKTLLLEILPDILENQKNGRTARSVFGAPTAWAKSKSPQETSTQTGGTQDFSNDKPLYMWLSASLAIFAFIGIINGTVSLFSSTTALYGIISLLVVGFGGGAAMYAMYYYVYRHMNKPKGERPKFLKSWGIMSLVFILWLLSFTATSFLPSAINPQVPSIPLIIIGLLAWAAHYFFRDRKSVV